MSTLTALSRPRTLVVVALVMGVGLGAGGQAVASDPVPAPTEVAFQIPTRPDGSVNPDPFLAAGVGVGAEVPVYTAAGTGPAAVNTAAAPGSAAAYIDYALVRKVVPTFRPTRADRAAGRLPVGMTITEAQGLNAMQRVRENLDGAGLGVRDITFLRIYVAAPQGAGRADYDGWNRAYRKYLANVDRSTGTVLPAYAPVIVENEVRPARSNLEVASLPVPGWLVEIEAVAAYTP